MIRKRLKFRQKRGTNVLKAIGKLFKMIISVILILIFLALALIGYAHFIEPNRLTVTHIEDTSGSMKESLTVALFADTHFGFQYDLEQFEKAVNEINENPPDLLLFAGDLIDNLNEYSGDPVEISNALSRMKANFGKYAVFGNHDYGGGAEHQYEDIMNAGGFQVLVNETEFFNASGISYADPGDFAIGKNDAYGNYETLQFLAEDLSDGDIIRVEVEGYQTLEFEISLSETVNSVLLIEEIEKAPEELIDEEILDEDLIKGEITDEAAGEDTANEDTKGEKDDIEEEKSEESGAEGEIPDSEEPAEEEPAEEEPTEEELPEKEPADSETADSETADSEATDSEVADSEAGDDEIAAEEVAEDDAAGEGSADGEIAAEGVAGEETVNEEIAGKEPVDEEIADDEVADEDIAADGGESEDFAEGKIPEEEISEEEILEEESEEAAEETASDEKTEQVDEEAVEDEASEEEAETEEIRQAADQI